MEHRRRKRERDEDSSSSESVNHKIRPRPDVPSLPKLAPMPGIPQPKFAVSEIPPIPQKKPKLWDYDPKKPAQNLHSGILQCITVIQDSIRESDIGSMLFSVKNLSNELSMSNDEHLSMLPIDILSDILIFTISVPESPEIVLHSIICITFLIETHHSAVPNFVKAGIISLLTTKLTNIEYIDVAEYAVKALEKISLDFPLEVLHQGFISEIFTVLDFFEQNVQRKMLGIILNISKTSLCVDDFKNYLAPSLPIIINLLQIKAKDLVFQNERALDILAALSESLRGHNTEEYLNSLLIEQGAIQLVLNNIEEIPACTVKSFKLLGCMCRGSVDITVALINCGMVIIKNVISLAVHEASPLVLTESLQLIHSMLPNDNLPSSPRRSFFLDNPDGILSINEIILPSITHIYEVLPKKHTRILFLELIHNLISLTPKDSFIPCDSFSSFISSLLVEKEASILKSSLKIIGILYDKIPEVISTNFIREGVVQRFKALKNPENLKHVIDDKHSDPMEFEQFLVNYKRYRAFSESHDISSGHSRPRLMSECRDTSLDQKKEIISLSRQILEKHNSCQNRSAFSTSKALKSLSQLLESRPAVATEAWKELGYILDTQSPTAYELSSSSLANAIWGYLFGDRDELWIPHYSTFLEFLLSHSSSGQIYFTKLLHLFMSTFSYHENFVICSSNKARDRGYAPKSRIYMVFMKGSAKNDEAKQREGFFAGIGRFSICPDPGCSVGTMKAMLKRVRCKEELSGFRDVIRDEPMEIEDVRAKDFDLRVSFNDVELADEILLGDLIANSAETPVIKFQFYSECAECDYLSDEQSVFNCFVAACSKVGLESDNPAYPYLRILNFLFLSSFHNPLSSHNLHANLLKQPLSAFINAKLNSIINKQFQDSIPIPRRVLPIWMKDLPKYSWFLFSYSTRVKILDNLRCMQSDSLRLPRQKMKIYRENILNGAMIILSDISMLQQRVLEVQYEDEIGTGNGPTLEFFSLLAQEIRNLDIWRDSTMLFPSPSKGGARYFNFIGKVVGKAILDKRYIELPFSPVFWKLVQRIPVSLNDIQELDPSLYRTITELQQLVSQNAADRSLNTFKGVKVEDLHLFFTLPGYEDIELKPEGKDTAVTIENLSEYLKLVCEKTLMQVAQVNEFRDGISSLIPIDSLLGFSSEELEEIICGSSSEVWDLKTLKASIKPAHGYIESSTTFQNLLLAMSEFTAVDKRKFLQFTTGCPRLPLGGFFGLVPALTVVRKEDGDIADNYLPSVMTCQNYLKLPNYSSMQVLTKNLHLALDEGHQTFHLS